MKKKMPASSETAAMPTLLAEVMTKARLSRLIGFNRTEDAAMETKWRELLLVFGAGVEPGAGSDGPRRRISLGADAWVGGGPPIPWEHIPVLEALTGMAHDDRTPSDLATIVLALRCFEPCFDLSDLDATILARAACWRSVAAGEFVVEEGEMHDCIAFHLFGHAQLVLKQPPLSSPARMRRQRSANAQPPPPPATQLLPLRPGDTVGSLAHGRWNVHAVVAALPAGEPEFRCVAL